MRGRNLHLPHSRELVVVVLVLLTALVADARAGPRSSRPPSGIQGVTYVDGDGIADPPCPLPPGRKSCASFSYRATIPVRLAHGRRIVATIHSNWKGHFRIRLKPGFYVLVPRTTLSREGNGTNISPRRAQILVRVRCGAYKTAKVEYLSSPLPR